MSIRVTVWNEFRHEKAKGEKYDLVRSIYPKGIHEAIASHLRKNKDLTVKTAWLDQPENGMSEKILKNIDVLVWWGHGHHQVVSDEVVTRIQKRVLEGMGFIALHSGHASKPFTRLMGTSGRLKWREVGEREILWVTKPGHPILAGINDHFSLEHEEMYGEFFDVPEPMETLLISNFAGGEVFRSGMTWERGQGKVFYFRPGHETYPTYKDKNVLRIIENAVKWCAPAEGGTVLPGFPNPKLGWVDEK
jgi:trehalose utilization protein